jgi:iron complex outermembrane receptor protein
LDWKQRAGGAVHVPVACLTLLWLWPRLAAAQIPPDPDPSGNERSEQQTKDKRDRGTPLYQTVIRARPEPLPAPRDDSAAAATVVTADRTPRSAETATELLSEMPGVSVVRMGGMESLSTVSLRGSTSDQVGVYLDGIPLNTAVGGGVDLGLVPIGDMERMEVYRGMSPIGFGSSAIGGIVSLRSRLPDHNSLSAEVGGGSFGTWFGELQATGVRGRVGGLVGVHLLRSAGNFSFPSDNGTAFDPGDDSIVERRNNQLVQLDGVARVRVRLSRRRALTGSTWILTRTQGLPGDGLHQAEQAQLATRRVIGALRYDSRQDLGPGGRLSAQLWGVSVDQRLEDSLGEVGKGLARTHDRTVRVGGTARAEKVVWEWLKLSGVTDLRYERFDPEDHLDAALTGPPSDRLFGAAGVEALVMISALNLDLQPSLRLEAAHDRMAEHNSVGQYTGATSPEDHLLPIARLSAVQRPARWLAFKANVGRYARLPSLRERYGNTGFFLGNPDLRPETGLNADAGWTLDLARGPVAARLESSLFLAWVEDLIQLQQGAYYFRAANMDSAVIRGVEGALNVRLLRHGRLLVQGTVTDARDSSDIAARRDKQLPLRPRYHVHARPELRALPLVRGWKAGAYVDVSYTAGNFLDPANLVSVPARTLLGAGLSLAIPRTGMRLLASGRNLTDSHIVDLAGYPLPGRSFFLTLQWSSDHLWNGES